MYANGFCVCFDLGKSVLRCALYRFHFSDTKPLPISVYYRAPLVIAYPPPPLLPQVQNATKLFFAKVDKFPSRMLQPAAAA